MTAVSDRPATIGAGTATGAANERGARLIDQVRRIRASGAAGRLDRWLLLIGGLLMPLGIALILLGWAGAAHTPILQEQIDYLISGGVLGLALTIAGGFTYFAYWQTVRIRDSERQARALNDSLAELRSLLRGAPLGSVAGVVQEQFVATPTGTIYHRHDCPVVDGRDDVRPVDPSSGTLRPCKICDPD